MNSKTGKFGMMALVGVALLVLGGLVGCGEDRSPVSHEASAVDPYAVEVLVLASSPEEALRAAKLTQDGRTVSDLFDKHGSIEIFEAEEQGVEDDLRVTFSVLPGALQVSEFISMTVFGQSLSNIVAAFQPSGLVFKKEAVLGIGLGIERVDMPLSSLQVWHIHGDGSVEEARITGIRWYDLEEDGEVNDSGDIGEGEDWGDNDVNFIAVEIAVPGFSRYSMGGGDP